MNPALQALRRQPPIRRRENGRRALARSLAVGGIGLGLLLLGGVVPGAEAWAAPGSLLLAAGWGLWRRRRVGLQVDERGITESFANGCERLHPWHEVRSLQSRGRGRWLVDAGARALTFDAGVEDAPALAQLISACCQGMPLLLPRDCPAPTEQQIVKALDPPRGQLPYIWEYAPRHDPMEWFALALLYCVLATAVLFTTSYWGALPGWLPLTLGLGGVGVWSMAVLRGLGGDIWLRERYTVSLDGIRRFTWRGERGFCAWRDLLGRNDHRLCGRFDDIPLPADEPFTQRLSALVDQLLAARTHHEGALLLPEAPPTAAALAMVETGPARAPQPGEGGHALEEVSGDERASSGKEVETTP